MLFTEQVLPRLTRGSLGHRTSVRRASFLFLFRATFGSMFIEALPKLPTKELDPSEAHKADSHQASSSPPLPFRRPAIRVQAPDEPPATYQAQLNQGV